MVLFVSLGDIMYHKVQSILYLLPVLQYQGLASIWMDLITGGEPVKDLIAIFKIDSLKQESVSPNKKVQADQKVHREMLLKQFSALRYLLRQGMAIRGHNETESNLVQLLLLRGEDDPQLYGLKIRSIYPLRYKMKWYLLWV